ncbi:MAG: helix-turn-helix domain-containing protein [Coriobacteriia bacterium]|nr:helix-turn-helix domain-containing protein [Coriobacteriia bacterium]MCL2745623.1 helix-turn-helix domain-containing protein [Coriobacteriia bacterium]MCL2871348.1 helix-turn-helix domain-containing protein [Coriobacteriia bacterium]
MLNAAREIRYVKGTTQREVSIATGITERTIARLEAGHYINSKNLVKLADYYGVTTDRLLGRET